MWVEVVLIGIFIYFLWQHLKKPPGLPPGEWGFPLIGYVPFGIKSMDQKLEDLQKKHGDIVSWRIGSKLLVILYDFQMIKEAFQGLNFINRPNWKLFSLIRGEETLGLVTTNGIHWQNIRRFTLRHLRDLGMGKSNLVPEVQFEAMEFVNDMKKQVGRPAPVPKSLMIAVLNVIWQLVASKRYDLDDQEIRDFDGLMTDIQENMMGIALSDIFPWIDSILPEFLTKRITRHDMCIKFSNKLRKFIQDHIDEHQKTLDPNAPRDFIDDYLIEWNKQTSEDNSTMSNEDLIYCISDLFGAGSETTSATIHWAILYLARYPEVQKKLQKEIDEVLPKGITTTLEDKQRLPYTEAFVAELLRFSSLAPVGVLHEAVNDTKLGNYQIPKGTVVCGVATSIHFNPKFFKFPNEFRPERFLDSHGKFVTSKDGFLPFGLGRRQCLGESLARMELFVFLTTIVQHLNFSAPEGVTLDLRALEHSAFIHLPREQNVITEIRS